jgi:hypothetical protein
LYYGDNNIWECKKPTFAKVRLPCSKVMADNAKGTVICDDEDKFSNRKFCLETGGQPKDTNDTKGTGIKEYMVYLLGNIISYQMNIVLIIDM